MDLFEGTFWQGTLENQGQIQVRTDRKLSIIMCLGEGPAEKSPMNPGNWLAFSDTHFPASAFTSRTNIDISPHWFHLYL